LENQIVKYIADQKQIELSPEMVKKCLVRGEKEAVTAEEITLFMNLCCYRQLNPFLNECYLVKFKGSPAQMITSQDVFINRANRDPHYRGKDEGVIVQRGDTIEQRMGTIVYPGETLIGGWCKVYRDDREYPETKEVSLKEYDKGFALWKDKPATMIVKVARSQALRQAFSSDLAGLYDEAEGGTVLGDVIDVTPIREPIMEPRAKSTQAPPADEPGGDYPPIPTCSKCGEPLGKNLAEANQVIAWCRDRFDGVNLCRKCQKEEGK
jgi:phage recombination protein Bet